MMFSAGKNYLSPLQVKQPYCVVSHVKHLNAQVSQETTFKKLPKGHLPVQYPSTN